jgi:type IV secretion system protein VirD4
VDLKGDTYADTANFRESELKQKIYVLDPKSATGHRFDPVAAIPKANRRQLAFEIVSRGDDLGSGGRFWVNSALAWWLAVWAAADLEGQPHMPFAVQLCEMGLAASVLYLLERHGGVTGAANAGAGHAGAGQRETQAEHDEVIKPLIAFLGNHPKLMTVEALLEPSKLLESKWATVVESVTPFAHPAIMRVFSGNDLDLEGLFYEPASIYVMADETNEETFSAFLQLTMKALGDALIRIGDRTSFENRRPILFLFDEFGRVQLPSALSWLDTMRSRGIVLVLFLQKFSQIQGKPGSSGGGRWEDDENSVHHWVIYKPTTTANRASSFISKLSGLATMRVAGGESTSHNMDASGGSISSSIAYREVPVVRGEDLEELAADSVFFVVNHERTFKGFAAGITPWRLFADADALMQSRGLPERIAKPGRLLEVFELGGALERQAARVKAGGRGGLAVLPALVDLEDGVEARIGDAETTDPEMLEARGSAGAVAWDDLGGFE